MGRKDWMESEPVKLGYLNKLKHILFYSKFTKEQLQDLLEVLNNKNFKRERMTESDTYSNQNFEAEQIKYLTKYFLDWKSFRKDTLVSTIEEALKRKKTKSVIDNLIKKSNNDMPITKKDLNSPVEYNFALTIDTILDQFEI